MNKNEELAFNATVELLKAKLTNTNFPIIPKNGTVLGEVFSELYTEILKVTKSGEPPKPPRVHTA